MSIPGSTQQKKAAIEEMAWRRWLKPWYIAVVVALVITGFFFWSWWVSPEHQIAQFQAAVNSGNLDEMMTLASPDEVKHLGLTDTKLAAMISEASQSPDGIQMIGHYTEPMNPNQFLFNRMILFKLTDHRGLVLTSWRGQTAYASVIAYNSPSGWHIALSKYLSILSIDRQGPGHYLEICQSQGVPAELFEPADATWHKVANVSQIRALGIK